jgi:hypothetical protein
MGQASRDGLALVEHGIGPHIEHLRGDTGGRESRLRTGEL